ncbi:acyltransferase [Microbacterium sp. BK668]|uniref:acyltransferase family protein n=1 Tax=Microbacterium sp. BK668 TaxID=2512118 RepID=UPI0010611631|nr:acyltransferase [Microbacterium sp. BK668]TDN90546.1 acyltransferase-like protein [Microbacterium sp. BK668]
MTEPRERLSLIDRNTRPKAWMDVAKGTAMFMVVLFHTSLYFGHADITGYPGRMKQFLEAYPMPAFFLIAGLFAYRVTSWTFPQLWKRRLLPLLWLYVVWSLVRFAFYVIVPGTNGDLGALPATDWRSLALLLVWPSNSYWFLYAMFWFTLGVWALRQVPTWLKVSGAAILSAVITSGVTTFNNLGWNRTAALFLFFLIGAVFHQRIAAAISKAGPWVLVGLVAVYLGASAAVVAVPGARDIPFAITIVQLLAVAGGFVACKYIARVRPLAAVFGTIGEWSLQIYLLHIFIIVSMAALLELLLPPVGGAVGALIVTAAAILTTYIAVLLSKLTTKVRWLYIPPWTVRRTPKKPARSATA